VNIRPPGGKCGKAGKGCAGRVGSNKQPADDRYFAPMPDLTQAAKEARIKRILRERLRRWKRRRRG
jgi:hypothetical protein